MSWLNSLIGGKDGFTGGPVSGIERRRPGEEVLDVE